MTPIRVVSSVALLSGGLDSCVALAYAKNETEVKGCINVLYGQRHAKEHVHACKIAAHYELPLWTVWMDSLGETLTALHATALTDLNEELPKGRRMSEMTARVPRSYVPGRNTIMLGLAQSVAEAVDADQIYCGFNAVDFSGYPDCRPIFVEAWNHLAHYSTKRGYENHPIELKAPIINSSKASVVSLGLELRAPLHLTWSCYSGGDRPCGQCDSCIIRWNAFAENGIPDPTGPYEVEPYRSVL